MNSLIKEPRAWIPIVMSFVMLMIMFVSFATVGVVHMADEGTVAHLFQIWLVLEFISIAFFAVKWLPHSPKKAFWILALQIIAVLIVMSPVYFLQL